MTMKDEIGAPHVWCPAESLSAEGLVIVIPVHDDWASLAILTAGLAEALDKLAMQARIIAVDDGSREAGYAPGATILRLTRNVGHQRAIAVGLDYALRETQAGLIAIMDADGEDRPEDLPRLIAAVRGSADRVAVARRRRRSEGTRFKLFYIAYKMAFTVFTGERLDFGNFCVLGREAAIRLMGMHELWLNLPGTIMKSGLVVLRMPADRGRRYAGRSRMNMVSLVTHGLSAIGVFSERAFTRVLLAIGAAAVLMVGSVALALALKAAGLATPGWLTTIAASALIVLVQSAIVALCGLFVVFGQTANLLQAPTALAKLLIARVDEA